MVALASVKLDLSMQIDLRCDHAKVADAAEESGVAVTRCAVDGLTLTVALKAVITSSIDVSTAADKHLKFCVGLRHKELDFAKNHV